MTVKFFQPVHFNDQDLKSRFINAVEDYFNYGNRSFCVLATKGKNSFLGYNIESQKQNIYLLVAKVISLVTVIFPLFMLISKCLIRATHRFELFGASKLAEIKFKKSFDPEINNDYRNRIHSLPKELKIDHKKLAQSFLEKEGIKPGQNLHLKDFFGHVYLMNLEKCVDRKNSLLDHLEELGLDRNDVEVFKATYGADIYDHEARMRMKDNSFNLDLTTEEGRKKLDKQHAGQMGCWKSHERIIRDAKEHYDAALKAYQDGERRGFKDTQEKNTLAENVRKYSNILIFEDDARLGFVNEDKTEFTTNNLKQRFWNAMKELPEKWDMFYFLTDVWHPILEQNPKYQHIYREDFGVVLSTYVVNASMYDVLLGELDKINQKDQDLLPVDQVIAKLHTKIFCYAASPTHLALQTDDPSNISGADRTKGKLYQPVRPVK